MAQDPKICGKRSPSWVVQSSRQPMLVCYFFKMFSYLLNMFCGPGGGRGLASLACL